jgi:hypothetical protein
VGISKEVWWAKMVINISRKKSCVIQTKHGSQNSKETNDHHRVNGSWGPGPRSPNSAELQSSGHYKEGFVEKNDYQYFTQKILCDFKQNTSPKFKRNQ